MAFNIKDRVKAAAQQTNMTEATGGGGYTPPPEGHPNLRLVGYYELGQHEEKYGAAKGKVKSKVQLVWELSGPKYPVTDGNPMLMKQELAYSLNSKATLFKLFKEMNAAHGGKFTHIAEFLGDYGFKGTVKHTVKGEGDQKRTYANLENIRKAERENDEGEMVPVKVDPAITEVKGFIWDQADPEMWDSIYIEGEWEERKNDAGEVTAPKRSKNVIQARIMSAINFKGSPVYEYATGKFKKEDLAAMEAAVAEAAADDSATPGPDALDDIA